MVRHTQRVRGFTLIELKVVIAILAVLAGLLLPSLSRAKARARQFECLSGMKQWALAFMMYVDENEEWIPREGYEAHGEVVWNTWAQVAAVSDPLVVNNPWYNALPPYLTHPPAAKYAPPSKRAAFYERRSFFHCPSARFPEDKQSSEIVYFSQAMNSQLITFPNIPTIRYTSIKYPSRTVLFLENRLSGEPKVIAEQDEKFLGQPSAYAGRFAGRRHLRGGNLVFADGHAALFPGEKVVATREPNIGGAIVPPGDVVWEPDPD